jgi:hypothetical protein
VTVCQPLHLYLAFSALCDNVSREMAKSNRDVWNDNQCELSPFCSDRFKKFPTFQGDLGHARYDHNITTRKQLNIMFYVQSERMTSRSFALSRPPAEPELSRIKKSGAFPGFSRLSRVFIQMAGLNDYVE